MPGNRPTNLRSGDRAESLGLLFLQSIAVLAPVPREEDVGIDAVATLVRDDGKGRLIAENSFYVQIKAKSVREIVYSGDEIRWLRQLQLPLFFGSVDLQASQVELYFGHVLSHVFVTPEKPAKLILHLDPVDISQFTAEEGHHENLGVPILSWGIAQNTSPNFHATAHAVLKSAIEEEQRNLKFRAIHWVEPIEWGTGGPVTIGVGSMQVRPPEAEFKTFGRDLMPFLM